MTISFFISILLLLLTACGNSNNAENNYPSEPAAGPVSDSGGSLKLDTLRISRNECTSPCPVIFSVDAVQDSSAVNPFTDSGIYWDYDDAAADQRNGRLEKGAQYFLAGRAPDSGASRARDINTPLSLHTYFCDSGICEFNPAVSLQNAAGDWAKSATTITVHALDDTFPATDTYCYSSSGNFSGCPDGATQITSNTLPLHDQWSSNTRYLLRRGEVFGSAEPPRICIAYDRENIHIGAYGSGSDKAELSAQFVIGSDSGCKDLLLNDSQAQAISTPYWNRNITLTELRLPELRLGMSFADLTLHDLDMDYENVVSGGGRIIMENANYCSNSAELDCANVPLPRGLYLSSVDIIGSRHTIPGLNVGLLPYACVSYIGLIDVTLGVAFEHNLRVECSSRVVITHSDILGDHIGTNGNKHGITLRPEGYYAADMLLEGIRRSSTDVDGGRANIYEDRYSSIRDVYLGTPDSINNASRISIAPSKALDAEVTRFALVSASVTDMSGGSGDGPPNRDVNFAGWGLTCHDDNVWETVNGCGDGGQASIPDGGYQPSRTIVTPLTPPPPEQLPGDQ
jgi:hypothetical protein